ncbi:MAG: histidine kinase [Actinomycetaceae bacterium]|nr:histidine kinase [Arcanobacterium sp.]MDD7687100.1 histidine kinase [Actinomycetaceae bacterium]MDY5273235.1 histidine kinase [Arcanobacterium sp.]
MRKKGHRLSPAQQITQLIASRREIVQAFEIERRRIERDLHDGAQQYLVAENMAIGEALLMLQLYPEDLPPQLRDLPSVLERAQRVGEQGLAALRAAVNNIHPKILSDLGLEEAIKLAAHTSAMPARVIAPHPLPTMPEGVVATAYFFTTEALTNCAKYAPNAHVSILLVSDQSLHVSVVDDGPGGAHVLSGHGLAGLRERLSAFGGELHVDSPIGGPTTVAASIPLLLFPGETAIGTPRSDNSPNATQHSDDSPNTAQHSSSPTAQRSSSPTGPPIVTLAAPDRPSQ